MLALTLHSLASEAGSGFEADAKVVLKGAQNFRNVPGTRIYGVCTPTASSSRFRSLV